MYHKLTSSDGDYRLTRSSGDYLLKYDRDHKLIEQIGNLKRPYEVAFDGSDNLYILDQLKRQLVKYNAAGIEDKAFKLNSTFFSNILTFTIDDKGFIYVLENSSTTSLIKKFAPDGNLVTTLPHFTSGSYEIFQGYHVSAGLAVDKEGNIYVTTYNNSDSLSLLKFNAQGAAMAKFGPKGKNPGELSKPLDVTVDAAGQVYVLDMNGRRIQKFSSSGKFIQQYGSFNTNEGSIALRNSITADAFGNVLVAQAGNDAGNIDPDVKYYDLTGNVNFTFPVNSASVAMNKSGSLIAMADPKYDLVTVYAVSSSRKYNVITGNIYQDANANCVFDDNETGLADMLVMAEPGPYYGISDERGNYTINVDTGSYILNSVILQEPGKSIIPTCNASITKPVIIKSYNLAVNGPDFGHQISIAPFLEVSVTSNRRRRCMQNITTVTYANTGFATATNAKVTVQLPEHVSFISADTTHTKDNNGNYIFSVGTLQPHQRGTITIIDSVSCANPDIRGLTVCTKAWITPVNTYPAASNWNKATITVTGKTVEYNQVRFVIRNTGAGDMTDSLFFRIYQDEDLTLNSKYKLASQDSLVLRFTPIGRAVRVEVDQPEGHPLKATAGTNVEIPSVNKSGLPSLLMMAYPPDDPEPEFTEECLPIIDSFDPNDKQVIPVGLTAENYTPTNSPLRYTVRFQNTGTDVAYRVVVVDTLSTDLDLSTLQVGSVSHGYQLAVSGKEKPVLTFTFDNIMLPDSTTNQAGSNGFIQFSIKPKANLPVKTKIENYADIFFDYNDPVRTNTTINRIYDMPQVLNTDKQLLAQNIITTPTIQTFSPTQSRAGTVVTITGKQFAASAENNKVFFNDVAAMVLSATPTTLTVKVPHTAFTGKIKVVTADGAAQTLENYIIFQPPTLTAISALDAVPGSVITLTGTHFSPDATLDTVIFNGLKASILEASETTLRVEVPAGATIGKIQIKTLGGQVESTQDFRVWYPPVITDFNPGKGKTGKAIVLNGNNFAETPARNVVKFGNAPAQIVEASATHLLVKVPVEAVSGRIMVETPGGTTSTPTDFTFIPPPIITSFTPNSGNAGDIVIISGNHFNADGQTDTVYFNEIQAKVLKVTPTTLEVQAPKGVRSGSITIAGAGGKAVTTEYKVPDLAPQDAISIFPNPTKGKVKINWFKANFKVEKIEVYNAIGKLIIASDLHKVANDELNLLLSSFGSGFYIIQIHTSEGPVIKRILVL